MPDAPFEAPSIETLAEHLTAYEFESLIAVGGMGAVYKARQRSLDRDVAVKILPRELGDDPGFRSSFQAEAKAMARLIHPNLISVYDFGDVNGLLYIVMELVPGKSLFHSAYQQAIEPRQSVRIVTDICKGLAHAHEHGIIHRDIKPANILLTPKREPKIGDFGLASASGPDVQGIVMGTPGYTAPEVYTQTDQVDHRSDIFSLGVILQELLTGRPPESDLPGVAISDPALIHICGKATHPQPEIRYASAQDMMAELENWMNRKTAVIQPAAHFPQPVLASASGSSGSTTFRNLLIVGFLVGSAFLAWSMSGPNEETPVVNQDGPTQADKLPDEPITQLLSQTPPKPDKPDTSNANTEPEEPVEPLADSTEPPSRTMVAAAAPAAISANSSNNTEEPEVAVADPKELAELKDKAEKLLVSLDAERQKSLDENFKNFSTVIHSWHEHLPSEREKTQWSPGVRSLTSNLKSGRVPTGLPESPNSNYSEEMLKIVRIFHTTQDECDSKFTTDATAIRDAFVKHVKLAGAKIRDEGREEDAERLIDTLSVAVDLNAWIATFDAIPNRSPDSSGLVVQSAVWGTLNRTLDVTQRVNELFNVEKKPFKLNYTVFASDPHPGTKKKLTVTFLVNGSVITKEWWANVLLDPDQILAELEADISE